MGLGDTDLQDQLFYGFGLIIINFWLMDIGREEDNELTGTKTYIAEVFFRNGEEGHIFFFIVGDGGLLTGERGVTEFFRTVDHDLDIGVVLVAFGVAFFYGFGRVFVDDGEDIVAVDVMSADGQGGEVGCQGKVDGFGKMGADDFVPG